MPRGCTRYYMSTPRPGCFTQCTNVPPCLRTFQPNQDATNLVKFPKSSTGRLLDIDTLITLEKINSQKRTPTNEFRCVILGTKLVTHLEFRCNRKLSDLKPADERRKSR